MTYDEYEKMIKSVVAKPDTAMADIGGVLESLKVDLEGAASLEKENAALKDRIRDLQDTNAKLFLGTTGQAADKDDEPDPEELEGAEALNAFVNKFKEEE